MLDIDPIKALLKDVKAGPWDDQTTADGGLVVYLEPAPPADSPYQADFLFFGDMEDTDWEDHATAAFVAHSREFVPQMIEEIERLRTALNTVGQTIYTQGHGTKVEQGLLKFIRQTLGRE